ncbi:protein kinase [Pantoea vagans]|uniref:protein kinase domain-containing protein n=1 Tax=Pantoea vagans TaxID=470934 RepID=UPI0035119AEE
MPNYTVEAEQPPLGSGTYGLVEKVQLRNGHGGLCNEFGYARKTLINADNDPDLVERFRREVKAQDDCLHKHVAQIFLCNLRSSPPWFVMELAECSLEEEISKGVLSTTEKIDIIKMVLKGLSFIHSKGFLHRDIKPHNILKFPGSIYKLTDFGLAKNTNPTRTQFATKVGVFLGTPKYFDYEIFVNGYSNQSDIYSIGVLLEDLYFDGIDDIILRCKHRRLNKRYINVEQVMNAIDDLERKIK